MGNKIGKQRCRENRDPRSKKCRVFYANQYDHPVDPPDEEELATPSDEPEISTSQVEKLASAKTITDINIEIETEMGCG